MLGAGLFAASKAGADSTSTEWNVFIPQRGFDKASCLFAVDEIQWTSLWARFDEEVPAPLPSGKIGTAIIIPAGGDCYDRVPRIELADAPAGDADGTYLFYYWQSLSGMVCAGVSSRMHVVVTLFDLDEPLMKDFNNRIRFGAGNNSADLADCQQTH